MSGPFILDSHALSGQLKNMKRLLTRNAKPEPPDFSDQQWLTVFSSNMRRSLLTSLAHTHSGRKTLQLAAPAVFDPHFPMTFLLRNFLTLQNEPGWRRLSTRLKRIHAFRLLAQRCSFFLEVKAWLQRRGIDPARIAEAAEESGGAGEDCGYCDHCGGCCEIAGGFCDFPPGVELKSGWIELFAEGLGSFHRFCPFLWESNGKGLSLCSIHAWRPNPCRIFAAEECLFLKADVDFRQLQHQSQIHGLPQSMSAARWLTAAMPNRSRRSGRRSRAPEI